MRSFAIYSTLRQRASCTTSAWSSRSGQCRRSAARTLRGSTARGLLLMSASAAALAPYGAHRPKDYCHRSKRSSCDLCTERHSAYKSRLFMVEYAWHPLHGKQVRWVRSIKRGGCKIVDVEIGKNQSRQLPAWMLDASICSEMSLGAPQVSLGALSELRSILPFDLSRLPLKDTSVVEGTSDDGSGQKVNEAAGTTSGKCAATAQHVRANTQRGGGGSGRSVAGSNRRRVSTSSKRAGGE